MIDKLNIETRIEIDRSETEKYELFMSHAFFITFFPT